MTTIKVTQGRDSDNRTTFTASANDAKFTAYTAAGAIGILILDIGEELGIKLDRDYVGKGA